MNPKQISPGVKSAVNAYLLARANAEAHREKVDEIQRHLLTTADYHVDPEFTGRKCDVGFKVIRDPKDTYLMEKAEREDYYADLKHALEKAGYEIETIDDPERPGAWACPALTAEDIQRKTEQLIVDTAAEMLGQDENFLNDLLCAGLDKYHKFIDLVVRLVVNAPDFKNPLTGEKLNAEKSMSEV